jgi:hypothetical protein
MFKLKMEELGGELGNAGGAGGAPAPGAAGTVPPANVADGAVVAAPASAATQPAAGDAASKSWLEALGDLGKDPSLQMFKEPSALAKSWVNAQKMIGADKVVIPKADAPEADWEAFYNKVGRPESPDKYEFKLPEGVTMDESLAKGFKEIAHKNGLSPKQVQALVQWDAEQKIQQAKNGETAQMDSLKGALDDYKKTLGGEEKFKATVDRARVAVRALADDGFKNFLRESGVGSRPEAIAFFAKLADMMGEDKIRDGTGVPFKNEDPAAIQREIEDLEQKMFRDTGSVNMGTWVDQRNKLYERLGALRASG